MHKFTVRQNVCIYDVCHDMQIACTHYLAINHLYLIFTSKCTNCMVHVCVCMCALYLHML